MELSSGLYENIVLGLSSLSVYGSRTDVANQLGRSSRLVSVNFAVARTPGANNVSEKAMLTVGSAVGTRLN